MKFIYISKMCNLSLLLILELFTIALSQRVTIDFDSTIATGNPEIFGVVIKSPHNHIDSYDMLQEHGIRFVRATAPLHKLVSLSTIEDYNNNESDIQNPDTWNWGSYSGAGGDFTWALSLCKQRGMKTYLSISYCPTWLAYHGKDTKEGVPKDWEIYKELVIKAYERLKDVTDMVGIWNEPNRHVDPTGSPYSNTLAAYTAIYQNASDAIRSIDENIPIAGPEVHKKSKTESPYNSPQDYLFLDSILARNSIPNSNINTCTYHQYGTNLDYRSDKWRSIGKRYGITHLPLFITEWNASSGVMKSQHGYHSGEQSLAWVGSALIQFLNEGIDGATIYKHYPKPRSGPTFGTYEWDEENNKALPHLNMRAFMLLSKALKLGEGKSNIVLSDHNSITNAGAAVNIDGEHVAFMSNLSGETKMIAVTMQNISLSGDGIVTTFEASKNNDARSSISEEAVEIDNGTLNLSVEIPRYSLIGMIVRKPTKIGNHLKGTTKASYCTILRNHDSYLIQTKSPHTIKSIKILNLKGRCVRNMIAFDKSLNNMGWDGTNNQGKSTNAGVYITDVHMSNGRVMLPIIKR